MPSVHGTKNGMSSGCMDTRACGFEELGEVLVVGTRSSSRGVVMRRPKSGHGCVSRYRPVIG